MKTTSRLLILAFATFTIARADSIITGATPSVPFVTPPVPAVPSDSVITDSTVGFPLNQVTPVFGAQGAGNSIMWGCWHLQTFNLGAQQTGVATAPSVTGTCPSNNFATTNIVTRRPNWGCQNTASAVNNSYGLVPSGNYFSRGDTAGRGGFVWMTVFNMVTTNVNSRMAVGLRDGGTTFGATVEPSTDVNTAYIGYDSTVVTGNLQVCNNNGVGTATCSDLGANFPRANGAIYTIWIWAKPNDVDIHYTIQRHDVAQTTTGTFAQAKLFANNIARGGNVWFNTGSNATPGVEQVNINGICYWSHP